MIRWRGARGAGVRTISLDSLSVSPYLTNVSAPSDTVGMSFVSGSSGPVWQLRAHVPDGDDMVNDISRIYGPGSAQPSKPAPKPEKTERSERSDAPERPSGSSTNPAARMITDLQDKVEISEAGRQAAASKDASLDPGLPEGTVESIQSSWYSVGFQAAVSQVGR